MKFTQEFGSTFVIINNIKIQVPYGIQYVTISGNGILYGWQKHPYIKEGYWFSYEDSGIQLGYVDWNDENDTGKYSVYEVQS